MAHLTAERKTFTEPAKPRRWLTPLVWIVMAAFVALVVYMSIAPHGYHLLYDGSTTHSWLVEMVFEPTSALQKLAVMVLAIVLFVAVMSLVLWGVNRPRVPRAVVVAGFVGPVLLALAAGLVWSSARTIVQSFQKFGQFGTAQGWAGWSNYDQIFSEAHKFMLINTVIWIFAVPLFATIFGLGYAVLVDRTRFESVAKALVFLPMAISMVAASVIWKYVYYQPAGEVGQQVGLLNGILDFLGMPTVNWTTIFPVGTFALIIVMIWIQTGFAMTLLSAAIKAIPDDIVEAAKIDGATGWSLFRSITVPSIRPTIVVVLTTLAILALKTFDIVNVMGNNLPKNNILANGFYQWMSTLQPGLAGAAAVLIFIIVIPVIVFNVRQMRKSEDVR